MPRTKILPSFEVYNDEQKAVIARIGPLFRDAADRHARADLRRQAGEEVADLRPAGSMYSIPLWAESAHNYVQNHFKPPPSGLPQGKKATPRQRARKWTDMWADEHGAELHAYLEERGNGEGLKARNLAIKELTEEVAEDEKARYREAARQHKDGEGLSVVQQHKNRKELLRYGKSIAAGLNTNYGIPFALLLTGYRDSDGEWSVTAIDNNDVITPTVATMANAKTAEFNKILTLWQKYVAAAGTREPAILPMDATGHCIIPSDGDLAMLSAKDLSRAVREVCTAEYVLATGLPSTTIPWVDIRSRPEQYFDVANMWLEDVQVEDPSHIRRKALLQLLRQYRARDERFLRFTGVQRLGELVHTGLYPGNADTGLIVHAQALSTTTAAQPVSRQRSTKRSASKKKNKGKGKAQRISSSESDAQFTDDDERDVTDILGGHGGVVAEAGRDPSLHRRPRARMVAAPASSTPVLPATEGLFTLTDYAEQPPDQFRDQRERHVDYVKALAPKDTRLQGAADHTFGLRRSTVEEAEYRPLKMMPWATWYHDSILLPAPHMFNYDAMWAWIGRREYINGEMFYNRAGQLEQLTLGFGMVLRELHSSTFDRASPSDEVAERETILTGDMTISSATDLIHAAFDFICTVSPPPSNQPLDGIEYVSASVPAARSTVAALAAIPPLAGQGATGRSQSIPAVPAPAQNSGLNAAYEVAQVQRELSAHPEDDEEAIADEPETSEAALRKRKRAETGPSSSNDAHTHTPGGSPKALPKPPSKVAKGHEFTEVATRSGRRVTVSEKARGNVVLLSESDCRSPTPANATDRPLRLCEDTK
ncbi:hypothetical protein BDW22DRAFT_1348452 [Trametopsis cervina]|nr:hypothetical protein BDW22DRAFT_1348452 [Trametopsis cervina]